MWIFQGFKMWWVIGVGFFILGFGESLGIPPPLWVGFIVVLIGFVYAIWWKRKADRESHYITG